MSDKKIPTPSYPQIPSAPLEFPNYGFPSNRGPPPSYEESQKNAHQQHPPPAYPQGTQYGGYPPPSHYNAPVQSTGAPYVPYYNQPATLPMENSFTYNYQQTVRQRQCGVLYNIQQQPSGIQTVEFDSGARFKGKGAGSVNVPPPPPGYLPTPAQMAALQGQPVMLKKKKKSFF